MTDDAASLDDFLSNVVAFEVDRNANVDKRMELERARTKTAKQRNTKRARAKVRKDHVGFRTAHLAAIKVLAAGDGVGISDVIETALVDYLKKRGKK